MPDIAEALDLIPVDEWRIQSDEVAPSEEFPNEKKRTIVIARIDSSDLSATIVIEFGHTTVSVSEKFTEDERDQIGFALLDLANEELFDTSLYRESRPWPPIARRFC